MKWIALICLLMVVACTPDINGNVVKDVNTEDSQMVYIGLDRSGYTPKEVTVESGKPVTLKNDGTLGGCGLYPVQAELGINANFANVCLSSFCSYVSINCVSTLESLCSLSSSFSVNFVTSDVALSLLPKKYDVILYIPIPTLL